MELRALFQQISQANKLTKYKGNYSKLKLLTELIRLFELRQKLYILNNIVMCSLLERAPS
jgi:hypothetical protein